jgi:hypothetical protein
MAVQSCGQSAGNKVSTANESDKGKEKAIQFLEDFYRAYISCCDSPDEDLEALSSIRNKCLTRSLLDKLENPDLDYDPITQAQDCDVNWIKTIEIRPDTERQNVYTVSYTSTYDNKKIRIELLLSDDNGSYKIDDILSDVNIYGNTNAPVTERIYIFENDTIRQHVVISRLTDTEMDFSYTVENRLRQQSRVIRGTAVYDYGKIGDVEIDEDEEGNSVPFIEYVYDGEYRMALRMDLDTNTIMRIMATDDNLICPLESVGILLKSTE